MYIMKKYIFSFSHFLIFSLLLTSCVSTKKVVYFENKDEVNTALSKALYDAKIMPKDILQIQVFTMTPESSEPFNLLKLTGSSATTTTTGQGTIYDYLVDNDGNIEYPVLGTIHLGGLGKTEAEQLIKSKIQPYMAETENVVVHVRMMNYKYAVLGGVKTPGVFTTQNEKVSILEAIAQAGDLTTFAYRDRIFLIRENADGQKEFHQLDINDANIINSPYFYLQQNDVVYVEPRKVETRNAFISANTSVWFSITSALMSIATFILAISK
jgi:polysaccharide export outer membrane protein